MTDGTNSALASAVRAGASLWVLSDVHANVTALSAALDLIPDGDPIVFLGDLLTYGCHPRETLEVVSEVLASRPAALVLGNHDQLYQDLLQGEHGYYEQLPAWLRETVDWTLSEVGDQWRSAATAWPWSRYVQIDDLLLIHANPYGYGDWRYLDRREHYEQAALVLPDRHARVAVVGHSHRARLFMSRYDGRVDWEDRPFVEKAVVRENDIAIMNAGSLGQPRGGPGRSTIARVCRNGSEIVLCHAFVDYDQHLHAAAIAGTTMSAATRTKLLSFFEVDLR